ncbi:amidohydrolase family protein [Agrobacterium vitis]|uniref:Amidohydrolase n=1 Tax=Agrobacterium vitis TaxID=373 RepID=A0AAE5B714_AGRVI|nr:amidohydrolase family protein [Agrobacterium vitis]MBF2714123.1 amidohydrolase [Agrobacterium vitis]MUO81502.1 amidohydrolase family protein [Agrobacterium vitis]MUO95851.1 amidohydrolase family protein [Agrobacterium vitis]MVA93930.1 amidohydrolase family protein [Agrobacterium vitis]MVB03563.1 amidohydrolase family protein [Agrobacterium vitis]
MYSQHKVLDVHGHMRAVVPASSYLALLLGSNTAIPSPLSGLADDPVAPFLTMKKRDMVPQSSNEDIRKLADQHARYLEARNIDAQILGPHPVEFHGWLPSALFKEWTIFINDLIFRFCQARPDRFVGACQLPQLSTENDASHMLPELERCVKEYAFAATYVFPDPTGRRDTPLLNHRYWDPLYDYCQEHDLPIIVHGSGSLDQRFETIPIDSQMAFVWEQYYSLMALRHSDVFERFPRLRVLICHCGGALDRFVQQSPLVNPKPERDLSENLFFDTCAHDLDFLAAAVHQRTPAQMCFGSESPGTGGLRRAGTERTVDDLVPMFAEHPKLAFLSDEEKLKILHHNPAKFCRGLADPSAANKKARRAIGVN